MEAYAGHVQDGHAGRERGLRGELWQIEGTKTSGERRAKAGTVGHRTRPRKSGAVRDPGRRPGENAETYANLAMTGMRWDPAE